MIPEGNPSEQLIYLLANAATAVLWRFAAAAGAGTSSKYRLFVSSGVKARRSGKSLKKSSSWASRLDFEALEARTMAITGMPLGNENSVKSDCQFAPSRVPLE